MMLVIVVTRSTGHKIELARESAKNTLTRPRILLLGQEYSYFCCYCNDDLIHYI